MNVDRDRLRITAKLYALKTKWIAVTVVQLAGFAVVFAGAYGFFRPALRRQEIATTFPLSPQAMLVGHSLSGFENLVLLVAGLILTYLTIR